MNDGDDDFLIDFRGREMMPPVFARAQAAADDIRARFGDTVVAVLFYGSCLRLGDDDGKILDFYVIVDSYRRAYPGLGLALWNRLLPPNVFYAETPAAGGVVRSKYAVLSAPDLARRSASRTLDVTIWARLAQPVALAYARDGEARAVVARSLADATIAMVRAAAPVAGDGFTARQLWRQAFALTYGAELRSEGGDKPDELYRFHGERYDALTAAALQGAGFEVAAAGAPGPEQHYTLGIGWGRRAGARVAWTARAVEGKTLSILRLIKAAFTFDGGLSYLAWKISRHSGVEISLTPWQKRHPVLTGVMMFWRLRRKGAFR